MTSRLGSGLCQTGWHRLNTVVLCCYVPSTLSQSAARHIDISCMLLPHDAKFSSRALRELDYSHARQ